MGSVKLPQDRDLLDEEVYQASWREVVEGSRAVEREPYRVFYDKRGRKFSIYMMRRDLAHVPVDELDEQETDEFAKGYEFLFAFGAINDVDELCYGHFAVFMSDALDTATEKMLEVDLNNRRCGIGFHLFSATRQFVAEQNRRYIGTGRDTLAGQLFADGIKDRPSPFVSGEGLAMKAEEGQG